MMHTMAAIAVAVALFMDAGVADVGISGLCLRNLKVSLTRWTWRRSPHAILFHIFTIKPHYGILGIRYRIFHNEILRKI